MKPSEYRASKSDYKFNRYERRPPAPKKPTVRMPEVDYKTGRLIWPTI